jgi:hypothetical protein
MSHFITCTVHLGREVYRELALPNWIWTEYYLLGYNAVYSFENSSTFRRKRGSACTYFDAGFLLVLFFGAEDGGDAFLRNVGWLSTDYTAFYPRRQIPSQLPLWRPQLLHEQGSSNNSRYCLRTEMMGWRLTITRHLWIHRRTTFHVSADDSLRVKYRYTYVEFEVLMAVIMNSTILWDVVPQKFSQVSGESNPFIFKIED